MNETYLEGSTLQSILCESKCERKWNNVKLIRCRISVSQWNGIEMNDDWVVNIEDVLISESVCTYVREQIGRQDLWIEGCECVNMLADMRAIIWLANLVL
jgi:hypothetical protein